jgi:hypothetical protein
MGRAILALGILFIVTSVKAMEVRVPVENGRTDGAAEGRQKKTWRRLTEDYRASWKVPPKGLKKGRRK